MFQDQTLDLQSILSDTKSLFFLIVFYPVVEELAFRGVMQEFIVSKTKRYPAFYMISVFCIFSL
ncbi:MAG: CPBP family intramembrane metalloprotease [Sulfurovum sp.]|nr:CPBP family intramembrane metalloprotease [Sulfurovum sp.]